MKDPQILLVTTQPISLDATDFLTQISQLVSEINDGNSLFEIMESLFTGLAKDLISRLAALPEQAIYVYYASYSKVQSNDVGGAETSLITDPSNSQANCIFNSGNSIKSLPASIKVILTPFLDYIPSIYQIEATVPGLDVLEDAGYCPKNAILTWLDVIVSINGSQSSDPSGLTVILPQPCVDKWYFDTDNPDLLHIGMQGEETDATDYLGEFDTTVYSPFTPGHPKAPTYIVRGDVRWYPLAVWENNHYGDLSNFHFTAMESTIDLSNNQYVCLPTAVSNITHDIRVSGYKVEVGGWSDDTVRCEFGDYKNEPGFLVVWRDDIPSNVIPMLDNLTDDILETLANDIWYWSNFGGKEVNASVVWPVADAILLGASQVETTLNNYLYKWQKSGDVKVHFGFVIGRPEGSIFDVNKDINTGDINSPANAIYGVVADDLASYTRQMINDLKLDIYKTDPVDIHNQPLDDNRQTLPATIYCLPDILSVLESAAPPNQDFQIQMTAQISFPYLTKKPVVVRIGPLFTFHITEIPTDDILETLANDIWYWSSFGGKEVDAPISSLACDAILVGVTQVQTAVNNYLARWLRSSDINVRFSFVVGRPAGSNFDVSHDLFAEDKYGNPTQTTYGTIANDLNNYTRKMIADLNLDIFNSDPVDTNNNPLDDNTQTTPTKLFFLPEILSDLGSLPPLTRDFQIQMTAQLSYPLLTGKDPIIVRIGPLFRFRPQPMNLPTLAVFFRDVDFQGDPLFMLHYTIFSGTNWVPNGWPTAGVWSLANNSTMLDQLRSNICDKLTDLKKLLDVVSFFWSNKSLDLIRIAIGTLDAYLSAIICLNQSADDLADPQWQCDTGGCTFNDRASSMILIGPPYTLSNLSVTCYEDKYEGGTGINFKIPEGCFFAAVHSFCNIFDPFQIIDKNGDSYTIPQPLIAFYNREAPDRLEYDFNDKMSCVIMESLPLPTSYHNRMHRKNTTKSHKNVSK